MPPSDKNLDLAKLFLAKLEDGDDPRAAVAALTANADGSDPLVVAQLTDLQGQRAQLGNGASAPGEEPSLDPQRSMLKEFHGQRSLGVPREDSMAAGFEKLFEAAAAGDPRVASPDADTAKARWAERSGLRAETTVSYRR